jgi:hypothetical protein
MAGNFINDTIGQWIIIPNSSKYTPAGEDRKFPVWSRYSSAVGEAQILSVPKLVGIFGAYCQRKGQNSQNNESQGSDALQLKLTVSTYNAAASG